MPEIVLTEEQVRTIAEAEGDVFVRDARGNVYTSIRFALTAEQMAQIVKRRAEPKGRSIPAARVRAHLEALQAEWDRLGGFSREYMKDFVERLRAEDPPS